MFCGKCGNKVDLDQKYCDKCGNLLMDHVNIVDENNKNIINNKSKNDNTSIYIKRLFDNNKWMIIVGVVIGVCILIVLIFLFNLFGSKYYFDTNYKPDTHVTSNSSNVVRNSKYSTVIIYDNTYSGVKIRNSKDAYKLIENDSVNQKGNCPSDIVKLENEIIHNYGITAVNLCEMDYDFAKELGNVFKKIYNDYPSVRGYITNLTLVNASMQNNYIAAFMPIFNFATSDSSSTYPWVIKTQVLLNTSYFLNKDRLEMSVTEGSKSGHFPRNSTIYSPVAHELGHYLSFIAMMKNYKIDSILLIDGNNVDTLYDLYNDFDKGNFSYKLLNEAYEKFKKEQKSSMDFNQWRGSISNYALAKNNSGEYIYDETIAEAFHDVYLNGNSASEASKYIVSLLKSKLES